MVGVKWKVHMYTDLFTTCCWWIHIFAKHRFIYICLTCNPSHLSVYQALSFGYNYSKYCKKVAQRASEKRHNNQKIYIVCITAMAIPVYTSIICMFISYSHKLEISKLVLNKIYGILLLNCTRIQLVISRNTRSNIHFHWMKKLRHQIFVFTEWKSWGIWSNNSSILQSFHINGK